MTIARIHQVARLEIDVRQGREFNYEILEALQRDVRLINQNPMGQTMFNMELDRLEVEGLRGERRL
jgi:hypothetical protein